MRLRSPQFFRRSSFPPFFAHLSLPFFLFFFIPPLPARVVTYTFVTQRANIDKSVGTKTSEGDRYEARYTRLPTFPYVSRSPRRRRDLVTRARTQRDRRRKGRWKEVGMGIWWLSAFVRERSYKRLVNFEAIFPTKTTNEKCVRM